MDQQSEILRFADPTRHAMQKRQTPCSMHSIRCSSAAHPIPAPLPAEHAPRSGTAAPAWSEHKSSRHEDDPVRTGGALTAGPQPTIGHPARDEVPRTVQTPVVAYVRKAHL